MELAAKKWPYRVTSLFTRGLLGRNPFLERLTTLQENCLASRASESEATGVERRRLDRQPKRPNVRLGTRYAEHQQGTVLAPVQVSPDSSKSQLLADRRH